jgi:putative aldouronate transport system substrate-binding protein
VRKKKKWAALGLATAMLMGSILGGCGKQETSESGVSEQSSEKPQTEAEQSVKQEEQEKEDQEEENSAIDTSQKVELVCYFVGDEPEGMSKVEEKINEILLEKINATISFNFTSWTDTNNKYMMILNGGEDCDIIYTAPWLNFMQLVDKNAFLDLNEYIDVYGPGLKQAIPAEALAQVEIEGHLYCIPAVGTQYEGGNLVYREDLRKKYELPVPDSIENIEAYLQGIKDNEPDMMPTMAVTAFSIPDIKRPSAYSVDDAYGMICPFDNPSEPWVYYGSEEQLEDLKLAKKWADAGYWSRSGIADLSASALDAFESGAIAFVSHGMNPAKYVGSKAKIKEEHPDWEVGNIVYGDISGVAYPQNFFSDATAIPQNSRYPERAMMAIEQLYTDPELNHLLLYGIEGEHYTVDAEGYYTPMENTQFSHEASNAWNFRNADLLLEREENEELNEIFSHMKEISSKMKYPNTNISAGYNGVIENQNGSAAFKALIDEYLTPVRLGMVDDVEGAVAKFVEETEKVGIADLREEFLGLWKAYCEEKGYE